MGTAALMSSSEDDESLPEGFVVPRMTAEQAAAIENLYRKKLGKHPLLDAVAKRPPNWAAMPPSFVLRHNAPHPSKFTDTHSIICAYIVLIGRPRHIPGNDVDRRPCLRPVPRATESELEFS